ncbi:MAG: hypothetical protein AAF916_06740 [Planctomycetota bacterium]
MELIVRIAAELQETLEAAELPFCFIGGVAVQRWGRTRVTRDVDGVIFTGLGNEQPVFDLLLNRYQPRREDIRQWAIDTRVLLLERDPPGVGVDISLGSLDFEHRAVARSTYEPYTNETQLRVCSASDLVVYKAFAGRPQDWEDIKGILARSPEHLDFTLIESELEIIADLAEDDTPLRELAEVRNHIDRHRPPPTSRGNEDRG